jgi:DNA ligase-1
MRRFYWIAAVTGFALFFSSGITNAADTVETAQPPAILLAKIWRDGFDPADFWVSEKLDGVRAIWDGHALRFRSGRTVHAPAWFVAALPAQPLDGELWLGRGQFDALSAIVRKTEPLDAEWRTVHYMIFDMPDTEGSFSQRVGRMREVIAHADIAWLQVVPQFRVADKGQLMARYEEIVADGGEGLMLHRADAPYRAGRSDDLLKLKPAEDAEATVIGHVPGKGRFTGQVGALEVQNAEGKKFRIGSGLNDSLRRDPPPVGAVITYRYQHLTKDGMPRFPRYWRLREEF